MVAQVVNFFRNIIFTIGVILIGHSKPGNWLITDESFAPYARIMAKLGLPLENPLVMFLQLLEILNKNYEENLNQYILLVAVEKPDEVQFFRIIFDTSKEVEELRERMFYSDLSQRIQEIKENNND